MKMNSQTSLPVSQAQAWEALNDIELLRSAIPGCESIGQTGEDRYEVVLLAAIGPVRARFKGELRLADLRPPESYVLHFEGRGGAAGHGSGSVEVRLESMAPAHTLLHYSAMATIGGKIAQVGSRLVDSAAQKMAGEFFEKFGAALAERYPGQAIVADAPAGPAERVATAQRASLWRRLLGWLRGAQAGA